MDFNQTRFKYRTYGHHDTEAWTKDMGKINPDLEMLYRCAKNTPDDVGHDPSRIVGGYNAMLPFQPIYFHDTEYRQRRHSHVQQMIEYDDLLLASVRAGM
jgi:hypothetical protein